MKPYNLFKNGLTEFSYLMLNSTSKNYFCLHEFFNLIDKCFQIILLKPNKNNNNNNSKWNQETKLDIFYLI